MGAIATQITSLMVVYSTVYSDADQGKHQSSASLAFVWGIHRGPVNSPHKWPVTRKCFHLMTSSWYLRIKCEISANIYNDIWERNVYYKSTPAREILRKTCNVVIGAVAGDGTAPRDVRPSAGAVTTTKYHFKGIFVTRCTRSSFFLQNDDISVLVERTNFATPTYLRKLHLKV